MKKNNYIAEYFKNISNAMTTTIEVLDSENGHGVRRIFRNEHGEIVNSRYLTTSDLNELLFSAVQKEKELTLKQLKQWDAMADDETKQGWADHCNCLKHAIYLLENPEADTVLEHKTNPKPKGAE